MDTMFVTRGDTALNANAYTHDGNWEFTGWNTEADGSGTAYANQASLTTTGNLTLYAQWHTYCTGTPKTSVNEFGTDRIDSVKDVDNNKYAVVQIGTQCWMAQNLRTETKRNGKGEIYNLRESTMLGAEGYDVATYGLMYDWDAVMQGGASSTTAPSNVRGICPEGWHVPTDDEWTTMTDFVYAQDAYVSAGCNETSDESTTFCIAQALSATTGWNSSSINFVPGKDLSANNATGFSALPAGTYFGEFDYWGNSVGFWSITQHATMKSAAYYRSMSYRGSYVNRTTSTKLNGFSVRCVRN